MSTNPPPKLSVVVVSFNGARLLEQCLESLDGQTLAEPAEVVAVTRLHQGNDGDRLQRLFPAVKWVHAPDDSNVPQMRALGLIQAQGEIVALLEDDCVAPRCWYEGLLEAHRGPWVAIGGAVEPGPYTTALDWAAYFQEYGRFMPPVPRDHVTALPGTNVSYKRAALAEALRGANGATDNGAPTGLYEAFLHSALARQDQPLRSEPALVVRNVNSWSPIPALRSRFHHGRGFAGMRVAGRRGPVRLLFAAMVPLLPMLQFIRIAKLVASRSRKYGKLARAFPWLVLLLVSWSLGEMIGYLAGPGDSLSKWR